MASYKDGEPVYTMGDPAEEYRASELMQVELEDGTVEVRAKANSSVTLDIVRYALKGVQKVTSW